MFLLGMVGGEGILLNPNEILELSYSWGIAEDTNNIGFLRLPYVSKLQAKWGIR